MAGEGFFWQAFVFLTAAVVAVPIAKRVGLGSVLGYLLAGIAIGPFGLGILGDAEDVMHFAEFGVVMMLFLVGLELEPALLWRMRGPVLGMGGLQVVATTALFAGTSLIAGLRWQEAVAVGMILALSSTAIVLQTLQEKGWMRTAAGQSFFAVLLFQDIAVLPMLAVFPMLSTYARAGAEADHGGGQWLNALPGWIHTMVVLGAVATVIVGGRYLVRPSFRFIAQTRLREVFVAAALLLVIGIALLMTRVGLSPALGTFLAGVVLANSEYRHELESDIDPFKGLLLGLFFLAVGASIDFQRIVATPGLVGSLVATLMVGKLVLLGIVGRVFRLGVDQNLMFAFSLAQGGEFAFVLFSVALQEGVLAAEVTSLLVVVVALSMGLTPLFIIMFEKIIRPRVGTRVQSRDFDEIHGHNPVIIAGFGRFGQICSRLLAAEGVSMTVLEYDSDQVDLLRRFGRKVFYGDASRVDLLEKAGAQQARVLILALDQPAKTLEIVHTVRKHFPHLTLLARARGRTDAYDLIEAGVDHVFRETFDSAIAMGVRGLQVLGHRAHRAHRLANRFRKRDEALVHALAGSHRNENFIDEVRRANAEAARILRSDLERGRIATDAGWAADPLIAAYGTTDAESAEARSIDHSAL